MRTIAKAEEPEPVKRMNLNVPATLHNRFKSLTAAEGQNMSDVVLGFIRSYVDRHSLKPKKGRK